MSSPMVVTFQPGSAGRIMARLVLPQALETPRQCSTSSLGRGQSQNQHVLRQPAFLAGYRRGNAQGQAFLSQESIAAVARPIRPDRGIIREVYDVLVGGIALTGPSNVLVARFQGRPYRVQTGMYSPSSPRASRTFLPTRVMMIMLATT